MSKIVRGGLIQATNVIAPTAETSKMSKQEMKQELETKAQELRLQLEQKIKLTLLLSCGALTGVFLTLVLVLLRG